MMLKRFETELLEESIWRRIGQVGRRWTNVISSFSRFVNMVRPRPPPIEVRISTFCRFLLKYWLTFTEECLN